MRILALLLLLLPALARAEVGVNLAGISDWSTEHPFLDLMRTARPWVGHEGEAWGAWTPERLRQGGFVDEAGWPQALPEGVRIESFVLTDQPEGAASLAGTYLLTWEGGADVSVGGRALDVRRVGARALSFRYEPGDGPVAVAIGRMDSALTAIRLVREEDLALVEAGAVFDPGFLERLDGFAALRFMDWMATNDSGQREWGDRPEVGDFTWAERGVPVEVMVRLADEAGIDPWFTLPHMASDDYARRFAGYVRDHLDPRLTVYAEWSNEVWNWGFGQAAWAREQAVARWGEAAGDDAWMQLAGLRAAEVADLWAEAIPGDRLARVVAVQTGWPGLEDPLLDAPLAVAEGRRPPSESFDAYAVTGYLGNDLASEANAPALHAAIAEGTAGALAEEVLRADLADLRDRLWPHHRAAAVRRGLDLVAYEAGPHAVGQGAVVEDEAVTAFLTDWSYSPAMGAIQRDLLRAWDEAGGTLLAAFVDVARPTRWGSWGALRHPDDASPRWDALRAALAPNPGARGGIVLGTDGGDALGGTSAADVILAGDGDDAIRVEGADMVDGGEGRDVATLPGAASDWTEGREGDRSTWTRGWQVVRLRAVEEVRFEGDAP